MIVKPKVANSFQIVVDSSGYVDLAIEAGYTTCRICFFSKFVATRKQS